jgi:hypothetical protein
MSANNESLRKLIEAARRAPAVTPIPSDSPAPLGFSTRLAARWAAERAHSGWADAWERLSWWGAGASVAVCLFAFVNQSLQPEPNPFDVLIEAQADAADPM